MNTKNFKSIKVALVLLAILSGSLANAQTVTLTLKDALNYAIQNNATVRKAKLDIENGRHRVAEIRAEALPQISGTGNLTYNPVIGQLVVGDQVFQMGREWNSSAGVQLNQQVFNQQVFTGLKAAKASEDYYNLSANLSEEQIIEQVSAAYYQVLVNRRQLAVIETNIKNAQRTESIIASKYKNGLAKKIDLDRVKVNISNLSIEREKLSTAITEQENTLKFNIGMPVENTIIIPEIELSTISTVAQLQDSINLSNRIEYKLIRTQENLLDLQKKAYKAEYYPSLALTGNFTSTGQSDAFDLYRSGGSAIWYDASSIGLTLRIPIFNGNATRSRVRQAEVEIQKNKEDIRNTAQTLNLEYENAKLKIRNSLNTINSQNENVKLAQEIYNSTQNNYNNGLATLTDLLNSEDALTSAQSNYSQALLNYKVAEIQLIKSNGNIKSLLN
ncbi:TolC family protein [Desertivirga xinjiangensis]|uniref:TolC family protein n=1 Tax=Desertivirga xinjiangensis TaxID=539206 RepID=UPI00210C454E|nr:TolC family protein [Pedobacter xinjiangensis]